MTMETAAPLSSSPCSMAAVIGVERVFADLAAGGLVEGREAGGDFLEVGVRAISDKIENMHARVAERAF